MIHSTDLLVLSPLSPVEAAGDRPVFSVIRSVGGQLVEFGVWDFPRGRSADCAVQLTITRAFEGGTGLVPRNAAAVAALDAYHATADLQVAA